MAGRLDFVYGTSIRVLLPYPNAIRWACSLKQLPPEFVFFSPAPARVRAPARLMKVEFSR